MKRDDWHVSIKGRGLSVLSCILLCAAVYVCGSGAKMPDKAAGIIMQDRANTSDRTGADDSPAVKMDDIIDIMTRDQIFFVCQLYTEDERYDTALAKWQGMEYGEAYSLFLELKEENKYTEDDYETAAINNALGCLCLDMGKHEEGYEYLNSAYVAMKKLYGETGIPTQAVLSAIVYYDYVTGRFEQCLEDARTVVTANPPASIWIVTNRTQMLVSYELGEYAYAIRAVYRLMEMYMQAQDETFTWDDMLSLQDYLSQQDKDTYDVFVYRCLAVLSLDMANNYAMAAFDEDGREEARKWYETSLFICQERIGEEAEGILAKTNVAYAYFLGKCMETEKAFSLMEENIHMQEGFGDTEFPCTDLVETYGYYGDMLMFLRHDQEGGLEYYDKARDLSEYIYGVNHNKTARAYYNIGKYYTMLNNDQKALDNFKKSEDIRRSILCVKDKNTIDLYIYLSLLYQNQGEDILAGIYQDRWKTIASYLFYNKMTMSGAPYYQKVSEEDGDEILDLSVYNEGEAWQRVIDDYINALQACDVNMLMDTLQLEFVKLVPAITSQELGVEVKREELLSVYTDFYQEELLSLRGYLVARYGEEYKIRFEPYSIASVSGHEMNIMNDYLFTKYDSEVVLEDMVNMTGRFQVTGKAGSIPGEETEGFLCGELILLKANGEWKLGIPEGFPQMPQDRLKEFLGIQ